jgi:hypothetical protein
LVVKPQSLNGHKRHFVEIPRDFVNRILGREVSVLGVGF